MEEILRPEVVVVTLDDSYNQSQHEYRSSREKGEKVRGLYI